MNLGDESWALCALDGLEFETLLPPMSPIIVCEDASAGYVDAKAYYHRVCEARLEVARLQHQAAITAALTEYRDACNRLDAPCNGVDTT